MGAAAVVCGLCTAGRSLTCSNCGKATRTGSKRRSPGRGRFGGGGASLLLPAASAVGAGAGDVASMVVCASMSGTRPLRLHAMRSAARTGCRACAQPTRQAQAPSAARAPYGALALIRETCASPSSCGKAAPRASVSPSCGAVVRTARAQLASTVGSSRASQPQRSTSARASAATSAWNASNTRSVGTVRSAWNASSSRARMLSRLSAAVSPPLGRCCRCEAPIATPPASPRSTSVASNAVRSTSAPHSTQIILSSVWRNAVEPHCAQTRAWPPSSSPE